MKIAEQQHSTKASTSSRFKYQLLELASSIRILALAPGIGDEPLRGKLKHVDIISTTTPFSALSYVWGPAVYDRSFECQSHAIMITRSLEEALRRIRLPHEVLHIWADGICINQQDVRERESQVKLMGQIYTQARQVTIWLGRDPQNKAQKAFELIREHGGYWSKLDEKDVRDPTMDWSPLAEFSELEYFKRIWYVPVRASKRASTSLLQQPTLICNLVLRVIQEGVLNRAAAVVWGRHDIPLIMLASALCRIMELSYIGDAYRQAFSWVSAVSSRHTFGGYDVLRVLHWVRSRHCLDDRDRIFAILGLPYSEHLPWNNFIKHLEPDYSRPVIDLYIGVACEIMRLGGTSYLLSSVHHGPSLRAWAEGTEPSWLPKWNEHVTCDLEHKDLPRRLIYPLSINGFSLSVSVECVIYDLVALHSHALLRVDNEFKSAESIYGFWCEVLRDQISTQSTPLVVAYLNIRMSDALCGPEYFIRHAEEELQGARNLVKVLDWQRRAQQLGEAEQSANAQLCEIARVSLKMVEEHDPHPAQPWYGPKRIYHPTERLRGRRLFLTERNQIGIGPEAMRRGDVVVNLKGSTLPLILRPQGSFYRFVGAARIHESMGRDAMGQAEKEGARMKVVEIR